MRLGMGCGWCAGGEVGGWGRADMAEWSAVIRAWRIGERIGTDRGVRVGVGRAARHGADAALAAACDWALCGRAGSGSGGARWVGGWWGGLGRWDGRGSGGAGSTEPARGGTVGRGMGSDRRRLVSVRLIGCVCVGFVWLLGWCGACAGGGGTGLDGDLVCCLDASMVRRTLESRAVVCAACTRPPIRCGAMRAILRGGLWLLRGRRCGSGWAVAALRDRVGSCGGRRWCCKRRGCGLLLCVVRLAANGSVAILGWAQGCSGWVMLTVLECERWGFVLASWNRASAGSWLRAGSRGVRSV
jgi:hypothetical protein